MKTLFMIFLLLFVGLTMKVYSQELPSLFGIELGKPINENIEIINFDSAQYSFNKTKRIINCLESALSDYLDHLKKINSCKFEFYDIFEITPLIPNIFFKNYSVEVLNNNVVGIIAEVSGRSCLKNNEYIDKLENLGLVLNKKNYYDKIGEYDSITLFEESVLKDIKSKFKLAKSEGERHVHGSKSYFWEANDFYIALYDNPIRLLGTKESISLTEDHSAYNCSLIMYENK